MANFNNNFSGYPYGAPYQPYSYPYGNFYQPNNMNMNQNSSGMQNQQPQMNQYAFVNGIEGAKSFQLQPNQTILLMDSDNPLCYMKSANGVGQSTLRYFKLTEISENDLKNNNGKEQINANDYVLKADFEVLSKRMDDLSSKLEKSFKTENFKGNKVNKNE